MAFNIRNYVKQQIKQYNPDFDTREGSAINDILVAPLSLILEKYINEHELVLNKLSLNDVNSMSDIELDRIGTQYLLTRNSGSNAVGAIYIYLSNPASIQIPRGTIFTSNGVSFRTMADFYLSKSAVEQNLEDIYYYTVGPIYITSESAGDYNFSENTIFTTNYKLPITPVKIINKEALSEGTIKETNEQFFQRIINSLDGMTLSSPLAIKSAITSIAPEIEQIDVIGAGDSLMIRDIVDDYTSPDIEKISDFMYTVSGEHNGIYDNKSIAYSDIFLDSDSTDNVAFPNLNLWQTEFTTDEYKSIYSKESPSYVESSNEILINNFDFTNNYNADLGILNLDNGWKVNDSLTSTNKVSVIDEVTPITNGVVLGKSSTSETSTQEVIFKYSELNNLIDGVDSADKIKKQAAIDGIVDLIKKTNTLENINNFSPILHRALSKNYNIGIKCQVKTTDSTENGELSYITILRNNSVFAAHDGFGLAWKKQPDFLIRMQNNNYGTNTTQLATDLQNFYTEYNIDGSSYLGLIKDNPQFWKYNVFLVDNNILQEDVWVGYQQLLDQSNGVNQFLQASKVWIEPNITYWVQLFIYEALGVDAWFGEDLGEFDDTNKVLSKGQSYPSYLTVSGSKYQGINGELNIDANRTNFGIGVMNTHNSKWYYNDLTVWSIGESFPMHLFALDVDTNFFNLEEGLNIEYYGFAYDSTLIQDIEYTGNRSKVKLGIYNYTTSSWDTVGYNTYDPITNILDDYGPEPVVMSNILIAGNNFGVLSDYYNSTTKKVYLAATPANSGSLFSDNTNHTLRTYYVGINNGVSSKVHRGNCTDIYCFDPDYIKYGSTTTTLVGTSIITKNLTGIDLYIQEILGVREYITQIDIPGNEYTITNISEGDTFSKDANYKIQFIDNSREGALIEVYYRYWSRGLEIEDAIINSDTRYPTADYKIKTSPVNIFIINNLQYSGGLALDDMKQKIVDYINYTELNSLDKSDLVNLLYENGANYVNLDMDLTFKQLDYVMEANNINWTSQTYTKPTSGKYKLSRFYTDKDKLSGLIKL